MIRRLVAATAAAALLIPLGPVASAAPDAAPDLKPAQATPAGSMQKDGPVLSLGEGKGRELYIVQLDSPALPTRALDASAKTTGPSTQKVPSEGGYRDKLRSEQAELRGSIRRITGAAPRVRFSYTQAINGIAVELTRDQARRVSQLDGVAAVQVDEERQLQTERGPEWIGAPSIWDGSQVPGGVGSKGEGVIVGIIDSGLNPANPSFHDVVPTEDGGDGYDHTNPWGSGTYVGMCDPSSLVYVADWGCNDKLIGYWNFTTDGSIYDDDGHGSHTGSTAAGNQVDATTYSARGTEFEFSATENIKGVAPHANIIGYDVCDGGCSMAAITAAIDQSIEDGVDVLNYSIGSAAASDPWNDADALGFLNARAAGIHVATSAGNAGPGAETIGSPGDVPWMTTVGATQHDRQWQGRVEDLTADGGATHPDLEGVTFSKATDGTHPLVDAADLGNPLCLAGEFGTADLTDRIVVCLRGQTGRVEKGEVVRDEGAAGMILANDAASGDSLNADPHALPAVHISYDDGQALKTWMASVTGEQASLSGGIRHIGDDVADIMAAFSSRGANRAVSMISPSVSAPGVDILAAYGSENEVEWGFVSGTSMASPHTAGALALLKGVQPDWSPAEAQSALMTTAERDITDDDGTVADWFDMGSGRIELRRAAQAGVLLEETYAGYMAADPAEGGDVRQLNTASMADNECLQTCEWTRTLTGTATGVGTWDVSVENLSDGLTLAVDQSTVSLSDGGTVDLTVSADVAGAPTGAWLFGTVVLTPPSGSDAPVAHLPVAVLPSSGVLPSSIDITTRRDAGSWPTDGIRSIGFDQLTIDATGLVPEQRQELAMPQDETNSNPYDGNGTQVVQIQVPEGATRLSVALENATAPDFDLFVGRGEVSPANEECVSASGGSSESCEIANPEAGSWWVLVQNWEASTPTAVDTVELVTAVVAGDAGNLSAQGPSSPKEDGEPYSIRTFWDEDALEPGQTWHGSLTLGSSASSPGDIGVIPVRLTRIEDDVTKTADVETAGPGDRITYTVEIQPNVTPEDLAYTLTDTLPAGTTYVEGSATNGAVVNNGVVTWNGTMESSFGEQGSYDIATSAQDESCVNPLSGGADYVDLKTSFNIDPQPGISGDTSVWTVGSAFSYGHYGRQYSGVSFTDDGFLVYDAAANWAELGDEPWVPQQLPDSARPNNLKAMLWQDMEITYDAAAGSGVSIASDGAGFYVVEYDDVHLYGEPDQRFDMQFMIEPGSNDVWVAYDNINGPLDEVTIGAEDLTGSTAQALVNKGDASGVISNGTVVCMAYQSAMGDPVEFSYQVEVNGDVHNRQQLVNSLVHSVDNPGAKPVTTSATVTVEGAKERSEVAVAIDPNRVDTGGTTTATATVFSAGEAKPTGQVEFLIGGNVAGTATLNADGRATATLTAPAQAGVYPVVARYLGDAGTQPSTSAPVNLVASAPDAPPIKKVKPTINVKKFGKVRVGGKRKNLVVTVKAPKVTPSGKVRITVKGAGKRKTYNATLNAKGKAKVKLPRYKKPGKVKVTVKYRGDAAVLPGTKRSSFRVLRR